jgi:CheY-like chemotaxis protein
MNEDDILFADEEDELILAPEDGTEDKNADPSHGQAIGNKWRVLIVDDEPDVHRMTKVVLRTYNFDGRELELHSAYSGEEAMKMIREQPDFSVVLLDVVMETDDAGLRVAKYIREELDNQTIQIILRTGQPGMAPEEEVMVKFEINDYKAKTELTSKKLSPGLSSNYELRKCFASLTLTTLVLKHLWKKKVSQCREFSHYWLFH